MNIRGDIFAAGIILALGAVLLALLFGFLDADDRADAVMEYEDWMDIDTSGILAVDGPVEVADGRIHAVGIGNAQIVKEDGSRFRIRIVPAPAVLVLMNGQSNAAYYLPIDPDQAIAPELGTAFYFGYPDGMPSGATEDVSDARYYDFIDPSTGELRVGDKGPTFSKYYRELSGKKVIWISLGIPGRMISTWSPTGNAWLQNVKVMDAAMPMLPEGFDIERTIVLWSQGESDYIAATGYSHYLTSWTSLHDRAATSWHTDIDAWYLVEGRDKTCGWVNDAFEELARTVDGVRVIAKGIASSFSVDNGLMHSDDVHYSPIGDNAIAAACAWGVAEDEGASVAGRAPIYLQESIVRCQVEDAISLGPVACRAVDGSTIRLQTSWDDSTPSTETAGVYTVDGTTNSPGLLLPGCPAPTARIYVGYVGYVDGLEYNENADGGLTVIGRDWELADAIIPSEVSGKDVTELADYVLNWGPWLNLRLPDTITSVGYMACHSLQRIQTAYIGDGLQHIGQVAFTPIRFIDGDQEISINAYTADPTLIHGSWAWDGYQTKTLYKVTP